MARLNIIILDRSDPTNPNVYRYVFWADVPSARQPFYAALAGPTAVSAWKDALAADNTALQNGSVVEKMDTIQVPSHATLAQDRKSTRLNSSHSQISYAVFCLKKT